MYENELLAAIMDQIDVALEKIINRSLDVTSAEDFTNTPEGMEKLDGICMLCLAIGEALKNVDKITAGKLLVNYPEVDWKGIMGFRDIIAHHYFDIDAEQVYWICHHHASPLSATIKKILIDLKR